MTKKRQPMSLFGKNLVKLGAFFVVFFFALIVLLDQTIRYNHKIPGSRIHLKDVGRAQGNEFSGANELTSESPSDDWIYLVKQELPNVPFEFWLRINDKPLAAQTNCTEYPSVFRLNFHNTYWQTYENGNTTFQLYSAYYDKRSIVPSGPVVRILAMVNKVKVTDISKNSCQLWYENSSTPTIVPVLEYHGIYPSYWDILPGYLYPYLISCLPQPLVDKRVPLTVSLVKSHCETPKNNLRIWYEEPTQENPKESFAVCVKGLDFPYIDNSVHLTEWLELLHIMGASKVIVYHLATHPNVTRVLNYYQKTGFVEVHPLSLAGGEPALPFFQHKKLEIDILNKRLNEFIPFNDCLYRNMYKYSYLAAIDIDEIIMPLQPHRKWADLIEKAYDILRENYTDCKSGFASICFRNVYFPQVPQSQKKDEILLSQMYMLHRTLRVLEHSGVNTATKCLHNTSHVHTLHNHFSLTWLQTCRPIMIDEKVAQLQHYRDPSEKEDRPKNLVNDSNIWRFKEEILSRTQKVLQKIRFSGG